MEYNKFMELLSKNGFTKEDAKQGGVAFLGSQRDLEAGVKFVRDDETPLAIMGGQFFYTGPGTSGINNAVLILTDERLIKADKKIKNTDMSQFHIEDINSSDFNTSFLSSQVSIATTSGRITVDKVKKNTAQKFNEILSDLILNFKKNKRKPSGGAALSGMDEIKKAKELLDGGIISQKEFDAIKKKHIG